MIFLQHEAHEEYEEHEGARTEAEPSVISVPLW
jgi:hypothetical protein